MTARTAAETKVRRLRIKLVNKVLTCSWSSLAKTCLVGSVWFAGWCSKASLWSLYTPWGPHRIYIPLARATKVLRKQTNSLATWWWLKLCHHYRWGLLMGSWYMTFATAYNVLNIPAGTPSMVSHFDHTPWKTNTAITISLKFKKIMHLQSLTWMCRCYVYCSLGRAPFMFTPKQQLTAAFWSCCLYRFPLILERCLAMVASPLHLSKKHFTSLGR